MLSKELGCNRFLPKNEASCGDISFGNKILLCKECKKKETGKLLVSLQTIDSKKENCIKEGTEDLLDIIKFNKLSKVRKVVKDLKLIDVDKRFMMDNGFMLGAMILIFTEEKLR